MTTTTTRPAPGPGPKPQGRPGAPRRGLASRLYRGETTFDFIGSAKRWYLASAAILLVCVVAFVVRGFNVGVEFRGGSQFQISTRDAALTTSQVERAVTGAGFTPAEAAQEVGSGSSRSILVKTRTLTPQQQADLTGQLVSRLGIPRSDVSQSSVSSTWGGEVTQRAVISLIVFLVLVSVYLAIAFQWRMAVGALVALLHDLVVAAGIYALVGFEVTPSTVVGLLTILGFSLYDTVVVFDKIRENTRDLLAGTRSTYAEAANLAVNQTLMRSINTSVISLLPVAGLLFVGAGLLGVGTIKDLALILFVGLLSGAYSSLFLAAPIVSDLTERAPAYRTLRRKVAARRAAESQRADVAGPRAAPATPSGPAPAPRPGARPDRSRRQAGR